MSLYIEDENGEPVRAENVILWGWWMADNDRRVAITYLPDGVCVSTVFLGADHQFWNDGPPILYETQVFGGPLGGEMERYETRTLAVIGHARLVARVRGYSDIELDLPD